MECFADTMVNMNPNMEGIKRYWDKKARIKSSRLVRGRPADRGEKLMDMKKIEEHIEHTLEIETEDISDRAKAAAIALKWIETNAKVNGASNPLAEEVE